MLAFFSGCQTKDEMEPHTGFVTVKGGKIWYRVSGDKGKIPLVMLHGGPGYPSHYLNSLVTSLSRDRMVLTFDQLGCGRSDKISDTTLMTIPNYMDQINQLTETLGIKEFYLYGHSWGTMLG